MSVFTRPLNCAVKSLVRLDISLLVSSIFKTGSCTKDSWVLYSLYRVSLDSFPCLVTSKYLPVGSFRRALNTSASSGLYISNHSTHIFSILDRVCKLNQMKIFLFSFSFPAIRLVFKTYFYSWAVQLWNFSPFCIEHCLWSNVSGFWIAIVVFLVFRYVTSSFSFWWRCSGGIVVVKIEMVREVCCQVMIVRVV